MNEAVTPFSTLARLPELAGYWSIYELEGLSALQLEIIRQATMIAYNNSFLVIVAVMLALIPLILLFRHRAVA